jgi:hypothetical protein
MSLRLHFTPSRVFAAALVMFAGACTTVTVTPEAAAPPKQSYHTVIVAVSDPKAPEYAYLDTYFKEGLVRRLKELNAFETILVAPATSASPDTLLVSGTVIGADEGSEALRWIVGFGAGREHVTAELELKTNDGKSLGTLKIRKAYSGGAGIGGVGFIDLKGLTTQVGEQAAQTLMDWSRGKDISD